MNLNQIKNYTKGVLQGWFLNKPALDKISESEDGKILYNNKELDVTEQVASIKKYQKYLNTELDYCYMCYSDSSYHTTVSSGTNLLQYLTNRKTILEIDSDNYVKLEKGKSYLVQFNTLSNTKNVDIYLVDKEGERYKNSGYLTADTYSSTGIVTYINAVEDIYVGIITNKDATIWPEYSYFFVQEINRQIVIDPAEYINESQGLEDTPVGHIISHMGIVAPKHYLICDGSEYNISDYPYLAQHMIDNFGSVNYFGGDGTITFAVPDLRGEFLRGTGTATRETGSGGEVGEHQEPTRIPRVWSGSAFAIAGTNVYPENADVISSETKSHKSTTLPATGSAQPTHYTSRPTNTSVLYCIKYEPTYFMQQNNPLVGRGETVLWEGLANSINTILTLNDDINNYDEIKILCSWGNEEGYISDLIISVEDMNKIYSSTNGLSIITYCTGTSDSYHLWIKMKNNICTIIHDYSDNHLYLAKIAGIKYAELPKDIELTEEEIQAAIEEDAF